MSNLVCRSNDESKVECEFVVVVELDYEIRRGRDGERLRILESRVSKGLKEKRQLFDTTIMNIPGHIRP
jgi:hypothetical protein